MITFRSGDWVLWAIGGLIGVIAVCLAVELLAEQAALGELPKLHAIEGQP